MLWTVVLRVPWTSRRSNQSMLKKINPEYSLEGLMVKLKLQCFGHLMGRADSLEKTWCWAGREGDNRGWDGWMASLTQCTWVWVNSGSWWWTGRPGLLQSMGSQRIRHNWAAELNWTELNSLLYSPTLTSLHDYWKNHSLDYTDLCWQSDVTLIHCLRLP